MLSFSLRTMTVTLMAAATLAACGTAQTDDAAVDNDDAAVERGDAAEGDAAEGDAGERGDEATTVGAELVEQPDAEVEMRMFDFRPSEVEVAAGETVEFVNTDDTLHTVTSEDELFDEELDGAGERVQVTFDEPGTYAFFCRPHNFMTGTVTVTS